MKVGAVGGLIDTVQEAVARVDAALTDTRSVTLLDANAWRDWLLDLRLLLTAQPLK